MEGPKNPQLFTRHTDTVLCCAIDNRTRLAVSGGIDDTAFVWDLDTKHVIFECKGHKESVTAAAFNMNSTYVATGDLNGHIQVRNTITGIKVFESDIDEINWIVWHNKSEYVLLAGTVKGDFWMWNVNDPVAVKIFNSFGSSCTVAKLLDDGVSIVVGYQDGSIRMFDLKTTKVLHKFTGPDTAEIISMDVCSKKSLLVVGCIDSSVRLFALSALKMIGTLYCKSPKMPVDADPETSTEDADDSMDQEPAATTGELEVIDEYTNPEVKQEPNEQGDQEEEEPEEDFENISEDECAVADEESVESVLFSECGNYLAAANNSGTITIWDVATKGIRCEKHTSVGITRCIWTGDGHYVTACLDGSIRIYDINLNELKLVQAHNDQILDIAYRDRIVVTASEDKTCRVTSL